MKSLFRTFLLLLLSSTIAACFHSDNGNGVTKYTVGGAVTGLEGTGLVLQNNNGDDLAISANGEFTFSTALTNGSDYSVTVLTQPSSPNQICAATDSSGTISGSNVINISIACITTNYSIGGSITGLSGSGLVLQNNGTDDLEVISNNFIFDTAIPDGSDYDVSVLTQPGNPSQTCTVSNGSGTLAGTNITNVAITCTTNTYSIGGTVTGLAGTGLVLQNNGGDDRSITADGGFTFASKITDDTDYNVTVLTQPTTLSQTCVVGSGSGTVNGANVTNVTVTCTTNTYNVGGAVSGLTGTGLVLQNNSNDDRSITEGGFFSFATPLTDGSDYSVTVLIQPSDQYCTISNDSGTLAGADVTNVSVECAQAYTNADLNGDYLFTTTEIHNPVTGTTYCSLSGTMSFDGAGNLLVPTGTKRCSDASGITTEDISGATMSYSTNADGSFTLDSPPLRGQIVLDSNSLLLDGTMKGTDAGDFLDRGIAMKRVTTGSAPTYNNASLNDNYLYALTEIYGSTNYCDEIGSLGFNGDGTITGGASTRRCSDGSAITTTSDPGGGTLYYAVAADGSFTLSDVEADPEPLNGQITLDGNSMLMDPSLAVSGGAHIMDLVAMKKVTVGSAPTYSNTSLNGSYLFSFSEIYNPNTLTYCDQAGTLIFDGAGTAQGKGTMRCTNGTTVTTTDFSDTFGYDVAPDGSFTLGDPSEPLHGQIVLDGSSLLLDGTLTETSATKLLNKAIAMKRTANEFAGTWSVCRDEDPYDERETHTADGTSGTMTSYIYTSTDGTCSSGESLNSSDTFTYTIAGATNTTLFGVDVIATAIDVTFSGGSLLFQTFYLDNTLAPDHLYMGDELADPLLDGSAADKRPIALQETLPRLRQ